MSVYIVYCVDYLTRQSFEFSLRLLAFFSASLRWPFSAEFSQKSLNAAAGSSRHLCDPSTSYMEQNTRSSQHQQQGAAAAAAGWGSCQILVLVSGCGATCCPRSVCASVCVVTNIVGQHTHTHTHRDTAWLCCNFFCSVSPLAAAVPHIARTCYNCVCVFQFLLRRSFCAPHPSTPLIHLVLLVLLALVTCSQCHKIFACSAAFYTLQFPTSTAPACSCFFPFGFAVLLWHLACGTYPVLPCHALPAPFTFLDWTQTARSVECLL